MASAIDALVNRNDVIVYDSESHACIMDGMRMHMGKRFVFAHNNVEQLDTMLDRAEKITAKTGGGILVITEWCFRNGWRSRSIERNCSFKRET